MSRGAARKSDNTDNSVLENCCCALRNLISLKVNENEDLDIELIVE